MLLDLSIHDIMRLEDDFMVRNKSHHHLDGRVMTKWLMVDEHHLMCVRWKG
jgi:hypothetical protein